MTKTNQINKKEQDLREMALSISHELNTNFSTLKLNMDQIKKKNSHGNNVKAIERAEHILKDSCIFTELLQTNFRGYVPKAKKEKVKLGAVVAEVINDFPLVNEEKGLIHTSGKSFDVEFDTTLLRHVLLNIIRNALYFIKKAEKGKIYIQMIPGKTYNDLLIRDTGEGVKSEYIEHIFDRFFSRRRYGTGMGLYFCKTMVEYFNGTIKCESKYGEYTEFCLRFPIVQNLPILSIKKRRENKC